MVDLSSAVPPAVPIAQGGGRYRLPGGAQVQVVSDPYQLDGALGELRRSMTDEFLAIDLEWKPDFVRGENNPVAIIQLASDSLCLLLQVRRIGFPSALQQLLRDRSIRFVGMNWHTADEDRMRSSFGWGSRDFGKFVDLSTMANAAGIPAKGLAALAEHVLGLHLPKQKRVTLSNWAADNLSLEQIQYAALDALVAKHIVTSLTQRYNFSFS